MGPSVRTAGRRPTTPGTSWKRNAAAADDADDDDDSPAASDDDEDGEKATETTLRKLVRLAKEAKITVE